MGLRITYRCAAWDFASGELQVGWGKGGRRRFWGGALSGLQDADGRKPRARIV